MEPFWESALENHQAGMSGSRWTSPKLIDSLVQCNSAATDNWMTHRSQAVCALALQKERDGSRLSPPIHATFIFLDHQHSSFACAMEMSKCFSRSRKIAEISDRAFEQRWKNVHRTLWDGAKVVEFFERYLVPVHQCCQSLMHAIKE